MAGGGLRFRAKGLGFRVLSASGLYDDGFRPDGFYIGLKYTQQRNIRVPKVAPTEI